jgi:hypothetical protein
VFFVGDVKNPAKKKLDMQELMYQKQTSNIKNEIFICRNRSSLISQHLTKAYGYIKVKKFSGQNLNIQIIINIIIIKL